MPARLQRKISATEPGASLDCSRARNLTTGNPNAVRPATYTGFWPAGTRRQEPPSPTTQATSLGRVRVRPLAWCCRPRSPATSPDEPRVTDRHFTPEEANEALAEVRPLAEQMVEHRRRQLEATAKRAGLVSQIQGNGGG